MLVVSWTALLKIHLYNVQVDSLAKAVEKHERRAQTRAGTAASVGTALERADSKKVASSFLKYVQQPGMGSHFRMDFIGGEDTPPACGTFFVHTSSTVPRYTSD